MEEIKSAASTPRYERAALAFGMILPTLVTLVYFVILAPPDEAAAEPSPISFTSVVPQAAYAVGKALQFAFPLLWVLLVCRERLKFERPRVTGVGAGVGFGLIVLLIMLLLYHGWLKPAGFFIEPAKQVRAKVEDLGLNTTLKYAATSVFYAVCHSFLEEYYWRWFIFGRLKRHTTYLWASAISSLAFATHHVLLLAAFLGWNNPATYFFSLCVAIGGLAWAGVYQWSRSLLGPWLSHALIDAGIFLLGYDLLRHKL